MKFGDQQELPRRGVRFRKHRRAEAEKMQSVSGNRLSESPKQRFDGFPHRGKRALGKELIAKAIRHGEPQEGQALRRISTVPPYPRPLLGEQALRARESGLYRGDAKREGLVHPRPTPAPSSWMRSAICRSPSRPRSSGLFQERQFYHPVGSEKLVEGRHVQSDRGHQQGSGEEVKRRASSATTSTIKDPCHSDQPSPGGKRKRMPWHP